jgi:thioredoxin 1
MHTEITNNNFQAEVIDSKGVVLVDFYAEWCAPCKILSKIIDELDSELNGGVKICKADIEVNSNAVSNFSIRNVPFISIFKEGKLLSSYAGLRSKKALKDELEKVCTI